MEKTYTQAEYDKVLNEMKEMKAQKDEAEAEMKKVVSLAEQAVLSAVETLRAAKEWSVHIAFLYELLNFLGMLRNHVEMGEYNEISDMTIPQWSTFQAFSFIPSTFTHQMRKPYGSR